MLLLLCSPCSCKLPSPAANPARPTSPIWFVSLSAPPRDPARAPSAISATYPLRPAISSPLPSKARTSCPQIKSNSTMPSITALWRSSTTPGHVFNSPDSLKTCPGVVEDRQSAVIEGIVELDLICGQEERRVGKEC